MIFIGFDDTDNHGSPMGTGRLARMFSQEIQNKGFKVRGIVRHQLPRLDGIPYTSNNSSACVVLREEASSDILELLFDMASAHLEKYSAPGSDPGLCIVPEDSIPDRLVDFGMEATGYKKTQKQALAAVPSGTLHGLGGTDDGIIGAAAAVGLTRYGWCGRFIDFGEMRSLQEPVTVSDLSRCGIRVMSTDRDPLVPRPGDGIVSGGWIRPSLMGGDPVLQVTGLEPGVWATAHTKRKKKKKAA